MTKLHRRNSCMASRLALSYGVICVLATLPLAPISVIAIPAIMWMSLRWYEDAVSASRALDGSRTASTSRSKNDEGNARASRTSTRSSDDPGDEISEAPGKTQIVSSWKAAERRRGGYEALGRAG